MSFFNLSFSSCFSIYKTLQPNFKTSATLITYLILINFSLFSLEIFIFDSKHLLPSLVMALKKKIMKNSKPLAVIAYKDLIKEEQSNFNTVTLHLINIQDEYILGPISKIIDKSFVFPQDISSDLLFMDHSFVDLTMWFESKKPLVTWPLIKKEFITQMDKLQKVKEALWKKTSIFKLLQLSRIQLEQNSALLTAVSCFWSTTLNAFVFLFELQPSLYMIQWSFLVYNLIGQNLIQLTRLILQILTLFYLTRLNLVLFQMYMPKRKVR